MAAEGICSPPYGKARELMPSIVFVFSEFCTQDHHANWTCVSDEQTQYYFDNINKTTAVRFELTRVAPVDFESTALTARPSCQLYVTTSEYYNKCSLALKRAADLENRSVQLKAT